MYQVVSDLVSQLREAHGTAVSACQLRNAIRHGGPSAVAAFTDAHGLGICAGLCAARPAPDLTQRTEALGAAACYLRRAWGAETDPQTVTPIEVYCDLVACAADVLMEASSNAGAGGDTSGVEAAVTHSQRVESALQVLFDLVFFFGPLNAAAAVGGGEAEDLIVEDVSDALFSAAHVARVIECSRQQTLPEWGRASIFAVAGARVVAARPGLLRLLVLCLDPTVGDDSGAKAPAASSTLPAALQAMCLIVHAGLAPGAMAALKPDAHTEEGGVVDAVQSPTAATTSSPRNAVSALQRLAAGPASPSRTAKAATSSMLPPPAAAAFFGAPLAALCDAANEPVETAHSAARAFAAACTAWGDRLAGSSTGADVEERPLRQHASSVPTAFARANAEDLGVAAPLLRRLLHGATLVLGILALCEARALLATSSGGRRDDEAARTGSSNGDGEFALSGWLGQMHPGALVSIGASFCLAWTDPTAPMPVSFAAAVIGVSWVLGARWGGVPTSAFAQHLAMWCGPIVALPRPGLTAGLAAFHRLILALAEAEADSPSAFAAPVLQWRLGADIIVASAAAWVDVPGESSALAFELATAAHAPDAGDASKKPVLKATPVPFTLTVSVPAFDEMAGRRVACALVAARRANTTAADRAARLAAAAALDASTAVADAQDSGDAAIAQTQFGLRNAYLFPRTRAALKAQLNQKLAHQPRRVQPTARAASNVFVVPFAVEAPMLVHTQQPEHQQQYQQPPHYASPLDSRPPPQSQTDADSDLVVAAENPLNVDFPPAPAAAWALRLRSDAPGLFVVCACAEAVTRLSLVPAEEPAQRRPAAAAPPQPQTQPASLMAELLRRNGAVARPRLRRWGPDGEGIEQCCVDAEMQLLCAATVGADGDAAGSPVTTSDAVGDVNVAGGPSRSIPLDVHYGHSIMPLPPGARVDYRLLLRPASATPTTTVSPEAAAAMEALKSQCDKANADAAAAVEAAERQRAEAALVDSCVVQPLREEVDLLRQMLEQALGALRASEALAAKQRDAVSRMELQIATLAALP